MLLLFSLLRISFEFVSCFLNIFYPHIFWWKWWIDSDFLRLVHLMWSHNVFIIIYKNCVLLRHRKYFTLPREDIVKYQSLNEGHLFISFFQRIQFLPRCIIWYETRIRHLVVTNEIKIIERYFWLNSWCVKSLSQD